MREVSAGTLCAVFFVCLSLTSVASEASLEDDVDSGWGTATLIETDDLGDAWPPQVAVDGSGNAIAVWCQRDGTRFNIWSNRYVVGMGWGSATLVETDDSGSAVTPQVAVDGSGNATAVWCQSDGIQDSIWSNRYVVGTGWGTATLIETDDSGSAVTPQVAVDGSGNAIVVWSQSGDISDDIWSNRYVVGTGWGTATLIETDDSAPASDPQVAVDGSGNAIAVWQQHGLYGIGHIWSNRYVVGTGWGTATLIETNDWGESASPQVAVDAYGNATAVWVRHNISGLSHIWSNRYVVGIGWGSATLIETEDIAFGRPPQVAVDGSGNAIAVWEQSDAFGDNIWSNRYVIGMGWGSATLIETDNSGSTNSPQVAVDGSGNAIAVWSQHNISGPSHIWSSRYVVGMGWGTATLIETNDSGSAINPQVAVDGSGNAIAVWPQFDGTRFNIWSNRYVIGMGWGNATLIETDSSGNAGSHPQVAVDGSGNAIAVWSQSDGTRFNIWSNRYVEPDTTSSSLTSTIAVLVALAVVVSIIFLRLRKKTADRSSESIEDEEPPPPHS